MGTVQLAEGEAAGSGGEKLGSCAQTVCPRLADLLSWEGPPSSSRTGTAI